MQPSSSSSTRPDPRAAVARSCARREGCAACPHPALHCINALTTWASAAACFQPRPSSSRVRQARDAHGQDQREECDHHLCHLELRARHTDLKERANGLCGSNDKAASVVPVCMKEGSDRFRGFNDDASSVVTMRPPRRGHHRPRQGRKLRERHNDGRTHARTTCRFVRAVACCTSTGTYLCSRLHDPAARSLLLLLHFDLPIAADHLEGFLRKLHASSTMKPASIAHACVVYKSRGEMQRRLSLQKSS